MEKRNRNILIAVLAGALLLCCCGALVYTGLLVALWPGRSSGRPEANQVVVITPEMTVRLAATPSPVVAPTALRPAATTPGSASPAAPANGGAALEEGKSDALESKPATTPTPPAARGGTGSGGTALAESSGADGGVATAAANPEQALVQARMPLRDQRILAMRLRPTEGDIPATVNPTPPAFQMGHQESFWVENSDTQEHRQITATLAYVTPHVYVWVENGLQLDENALQRSADRFEQKTYPTTREFFGSEWTPGVDNDVHLSMLHASGLGENIAGYYSSSDEYSRQVNPYSNQKEMFYIASGDDKAEANTSFYDGVLAHEFQHMIHWHNDPQEASWVNEGMSELAAELNGFDVGGAETTYAGNPDTQLTSWSDPSEGNAAHYGASYLFMNYFLDRFGEDLTRAVVATKQQGIQGFDSVLAAAGRTERFDDIFADWLVANYLDRPDAAPKGRFGYPDIDPPAPEPAETYWLFPVDGQAQVSQYGADYIQLRARGELTVNFNGQTSAKVVNTEPRGRYAWYSNRGDDSDATLTRSFDLRGVTTATLTFSAWYDIEDGWDYAYVEVSADGGKHWQIIPGRQTRNKVSAGNAFGPGWTGASGGGKRPQWIAERVDLTPFAGKQIQLRFEYITDDAVNGPGFLLDNIAIPELDYQDGGEQGPSGWQAAGWVLTDNRLTERWLVQLIAANRGSVTVQRLPVGPDGKGSLVLPNAQQYDHLMLVVSALAPVTTEPASYSYTLTQR